MGGWASSFFSSLPSQSEAKPDYEELATRGRESAAEQQSSRAAGQRSRARNQAAIAAAAAAASSKAICMYLDTYLWQ